jgi:hypothetical protein
VKVYKGVSVSSILLTGNGGNIIFIQLINCEKRRLEICVLKAGEKWVLVFRVPYDILVCFIMKLDCSTSPGINC